MNSRGNKKMCVWCPVHARQFCKVLPALAGAAEEEGGGVVAVTDADGKETDDSAAGGAGASASLDERFAPGGYSRSGSGRQSVMRVVTHVVVAVSSLGFFRTDLSCENRYVISFHVTGYVL